MDVEWILTTSYNIFDTVAACWQSEKLKLQLQDTDNEPLKQKTEGKWQLQIGKTLMCTRYCLLPSRGCRWEDSFTG